MIAFLRCWSVTLTTAKASQPGERHPEYVLPLTFERSNFWLCIWWCGPVMHYKFLSIPGLFYPVLVLRGRKHLWHHGTGYKERATRGRFYRKSAYFKLLFCRLTLNTKKLGVCVQGMTGEKAKMGNDKMRYDLAHPDARLNKRRLNLIGYDMNFTIG